MRVKSKLIKLAHETGWSVHGHHGAWRYLEREDWKIIFTVQGWKVVRIVDGNQAEDMGTRPLLDIAIRYANGLIDKQAEISEDARDTFDPWNECPVCRLPVPQGKKHLITNFGCTLGVMEDDSTNDNGKTKAQA